MKIGVITDIHSNIQALNAVLDELDKIKVDKIICCGDIIGIGPNPEEVVQALIKRKNIIIAVRGNHEQYLLKGLPKHIHDDKRSMGDEEIKNHKWTHSKLSDSSKEFLEELPISKMIQIENIKIYIEHYPREKTGTFKKHFKNPTIEQNEEMFSGIDADIFIYGHTHTTSVNNKNGKWYINPGSLGCPEKSNIANAGILKIDNDNMEFEKLNIEYNVDITKQTIEDFKFPYYEKILKVFYGKI